MLTPELSAADRRAISPYQVATAAGIEEPTITGGAGATSYLAQAVDAHGRAEFPAPIALPKSSSRRMASRCDTRIPSGAAICTA